MSRDVLEKILNGEGLSHGKQSTLQSNQINSQTM